MKKTQSKSQFSAFTLIELLVVIAIIGILAGLLFPAIQGALVNANALRVGNNGRSVVLAVISANTEREAMNMGSVWPSKTASFSKTPDYTTIANSEVYFADLINSEAVENISWSVFAGGGVQAAKNESDFTGGNCNVWNLIAGLDENTSDDTPFLFSRNFCLLTRGELEGRSPMNTLFDPSVVPTPFGDKLVVFIQKGAAMQTVKRKYLNDANLFLGGSTFGGTTNKNAAIIKALVN